MSRSSPDSIDGASPWAARIPRSRTVAVGGLRLEPQVTVGLQDADVWLRGPSLSRSLLRALRAIPDADLFYVTPGDLLTPVGHLLPVGPLPALSWQPLAKWYRVELPDAGLPGRMPDPVVLKLVRQAKEVPANVLLSDFQRWAAWATAAPQLRLNNLRFAACRDGRVVVRGTPLPPISGLRFVEASGVAVECGWSWTPPLDATTIRAVFGLRGEDLALWHGAGGWERISGPLFVPATRSAVRMSKV